MTVTLELTKEEEAKLKASAELAGLEPTEYLRRLIVTPAAYDVTCDAAYSPEWSDEDMADVRKASLRHLASQLGE